MSNSNTEETSSKGYQNLQHGSQFLQPIEEEGVNLLELWKTLWSGKWIVISITVAAVIGSFIFSKYQTPFYRAKTMLLPPKIGDIDGLILTEFMSEGANVQGDIFTAFTINLSSRILQKKFIKNYDLIETLDPKGTLESHSNHIYPRFAGMIRIEGDKAITVFIEHFDRNQSAKWLNDYIGFIDTETVKMLADNMRNSIGNQIRDIQYKIESKRVIAKKRREDQIVQLDEAYLIATELGIIDRIDTNTTNVVQNTQLEGFKDNSKSSSPLYYRGSKAIKVEINMLKNRISDDPFISGLRDLQEKHNLLLSIKNIEEKGMHSVTVDQKAFVPLKRFKPNRRLIVSAGTSMGFFFSIFFVLFISFLQKQKQNYPEIFKKV